MADAAAYKDKGNAAFSAGNFAEAIEHFSAGIALDPSNHVLYSNRSASYASLKQFDKALEDAERVVSMKPDWVRGYSRKAAALHGLERLDDAIETYKKGIELDPGNAQLKESLASVEADKKREDDPMAKMQNVFTENIWAKLSADPSTRAYLNQPDFVAKIRDLIANPGNLQAHFSDQRILQAWAIGMGLNMKFASNPEEAAAAAGNAAEWEKSEDVPMKESKPQEAKKEAKKPEPKKEMTEEEKQHAQAEALKDEGNALYKQKKFAEAIKKYEEAVALWPENIAYLNNKAAALMEAGDFDACIHVCEEAITKGREVRADFAQLAKSYARIGNAYAKQHKYAEAVEAYKKSLFEHRTSEIVNKLHQVEQLKKDADAKAYINPEIALQEKEKGNALFKEGKWTEAIECYSEAIRRNPEDPTFYSNRAACYLKIMQFSNALSDAEKCLELNPNFAKGFARKGNAHFGMKEYHKALAAFDAGMKIDPELAELREGAERVAAAMYREQASGQVDPERAARAMSDPEIQGILRDPMINEALLAMQNNPALTQEYMRNPAFAEKIRKLVAAGVLQTR